MVGPGVGDLIMITDERGVTRPLVSYAGLAGMVIDEYSGMLRVRFSGEDIERRWDRPRFTVGTRDVWFWPSEVKLLIKRYDLIEHDV
jgi:hypothetical protein